MMIWCFAGTALTGFVLSYFGCLAIRLFGPSFGLVDKPGQRKIHEKVMPTDGGLAIWFAVVAPLALGQLIIFLLVWDRTDAVISLPLPDFFEIHLPGLLEKSVNLWQLLGLGTVLVILGLWDDLHGLPWKFRIFTQFAVAMIAVKLGWRASLFIGENGLTYWLSVFWIAGLINSFNMLDNMDGLSAGIAVLCGACFAIVMLCRPANQPQLFLGGFQILLVGAVCGFLVHNRPPARLFMGDSGAYFIGFLLAASTLSATFADYGHSGQTIFVPFCILAIPIYDTCSVVWIRLKEGRSPFVGDQSHFSHRLVEIGLSKPNAVLTIYLATGICCLGAVLLYHTDFIGACLIFAQILFILTLIAILESKGRTKNRPERRKK
jgi:UDP-GlcNAc:undecaprenyl-phosphate GlcNAc-1-phosphate transferase